MYQLMSDSQIRCSNVLFVVVHLLGTKSKSYLEYNSLTSVICFFSAMLVSFIAILTNKERTLLYKY